MQQKIFRIAQFGTYDIESLGDTSFPKMLIFGLSKHVFCETELFSLSECAVPYNFNSHVYSFEQFSVRHERKPFDAIVIGGGEFLHFKKMDVVISGKATSYPEGYIWRKPLEFAAAYNIPAYINCVGVPYDFTASQQKELRSAVKPVQYLSVRDEYSALRLRAAGLNEVSCVADNLWYMNQMYTKDRLEALRGELEKRTGRDFTTPYVIVQYGTTKNAKALAEQLMNIKDETGYRICLMPVNYCHEDRLGMRLLKDAGGDAFEEITDYFQPEEMISVISGAKGFCGTSLHGNLTAASYGVPFVGIDMYPSFVSKMDGIFAMLQCESYLIPDEASLAAAFCARRQDTDIKGVIKRKISEMQEKLDRHFERIGESLRGVWVNEER